MPSVSAWLDHPDHDYLRHCCAIDYVLCGKEIWDVRIDEIERTQLRVGEDRGWFDVELPKAEKGHALLTLKWEWEGRHTDELYQIVDDAIYREACSGAGP